MEPREPHPHASRSPRPKTRVGEVRLKCRKKIHRTSWMGGVDPMNIVIGTAVLAAPVVGAGIVLLAVVIVAAILIVILW